MRKIVQSLKIIDGCLFETIPGKKFPSLLFARRGIEKDVLIFEKTQFFLFLRLKTRKYHSIIYFCKGIDWILIGDTFLILVVMGSRQWAQKEIFFFRFISLNFAIELVIIGACIRNFWLPFTLKNVDLDGDWDCKDVVMKVLMDVMPKRKGGCCRIFSLPLFNSS